MCHSPNPRAERRRTFTGCKTCRNRHVKCDDARPSCGPCRQAGLTCGRYWSPLLWITESVTGSPKEHQGRQRGFEFRYPVLSEAQRRHMSDEISNSLGRRSAPDLIARLDASCYRFETRGERVSGLSRGPFGAFSAHAQIPDDPPSGHEVNQPVAAYVQLALPPEPEEPPENIEWAGLCEEFRGTESEGLLQSLGSVIDLDQWVNGNHGPEPAFEGNLTDSLFGSMPVDDLPQLVDDLPQLDGDFLFCAPSDNFSADQREHGRASVMRSRSPSVGIVAPDLTPTSEPILPVHSEPLLRHYRQQIYEVGLDQSKRESPWQLIFFPCALETFAELSLWRNTSRTRFALLYGLLALSAFRLHTKSNSDFRGKSWHSIGVQYQTTAQRHLRAALKTEMTGAGQTKYKELLMAILAISMISLSRGGSSFQVFLLDAERFIRRQGLTGDISYEYRLLHHMYSHLRVLSESIGACLESPTDDPTRAYNEPPEKDGRFCLAEECYDIGLDPAEEKTPEVGYTDIHFQVQGHWNRSLFPTIYGFPESLWTLLSQTVATANEKARIESLDPPNPTLKRALENHVQHLERTIWAWTPTSDVIGPQVPEHLSSPRNRDALDNLRVKSLAQGLHQALIIYFHRRIFNIGPMLLQDVARKTFDYLEPCLTQLDDQDLTVCIAWATLTAACEATSLELQEKALKILAVADEQGIYITNRPAKEVVGLVWEQRKISRN